MITKIQLSLSGGEPGETIDLSYSKDDTTCYVTLHCRGCDYEGVSWNLFDALCKARLQLEPQGLIPVLLPVTIIAGDFFKIISEDKG